MNRRPRIVPALLSLSLASFASVSAQRRPQQPTARPAASPAEQLAIDTVAYSRLRWRYIGPEGNRITSVTGVAGDPNVYYAGAASGGIFKTTDGGIFWQPVFDDQPVSSVGALAVAPSDANVVWAGTGEPFIRSHISVGWGVYRSTDAGKTWTKMGLENTGRIARVVVDPRDPDRVFVAALGHAYGPQPDRGVYRTLDGGSTWTRVLFVNDSTGACDVVMDPNNPRVLYAATWQIEIHTWGRTSGGAGSGIWKSTDGGTTWKRLTGNGLPTRRIGKIGLGVTRANSNRVYALIETGDGVPLPDGQPTDSGRLFRSDDAGATWQLVSSDRQPAGRTHYYNRMGVEPDNADEAYFLSANWTKTLDGGRTIIDPPQREIPGGDHHDIWIDPTNGNRMIVSHDGGTSITTNRGRSWLRVELPVAQMYHVTTDNRIPYNVYGNRQDGPSAMGPSNSKTAGFGDDGPSKITRGMWRTVGGGESGWATPDTVDTNLVWSSASGFGSVGGIVTRYDMRTAVTNEVEVWPQSSIGWGADSLKYRFVWTFPLTISPRDHNKVYVGSQHVHVTTDGGKSWRELSPDLTRNDKGRQRLSGGLTPDNIGVEYSGVVFAIAESRLDPQLLWVGTNDGLVHVSRDGGATWTNVAQNIPGLLPWGTISNIEPSRFDAGTAYLTVDGHQVNNRDPWVYKTTDYGKSWKLITSGLPHTPLSYAHCVREDPVRRGLLYLATEGGVYVSFDDGGGWQPLQNNLPHAPAYWLTVQEHFNDLVLATYGRGIWILDDVTPLRTLGAEVLTKEAHLFAPRPVYRFRTVEAPFAHDDDMTAGQNPPYGAPLNFWLKKPQGAADSTKHDSVTITVSDAAGAVVRTIKAPALTGINRTWWNLRYDQTKQAKIRVSPEYSPWVGVPLEGKNAPGVGRDALLAPPGTYTVKLTARGATQSQPLVVKKDPSSGGSDEEIRVNTALAQSILRDVNGSVDMINALENVRGQLAAMKASLGTDSARTTDHSAVRASADSLDARLLTVERKLFQTRVTGRGQDVIRWPMRIAEQLLYLHGSVSQSDYAPTAAQRAVAEELHAQLGRVKGEFDQLMQRDVAGFNAMLRQRNVQNVIIGAR